MDVCWTTCFVELGNARMTYDFRIEQFKHLANTGVAFVVYACSKTLPTLVEALKEYEQVRVVGVSLNDYAMYSVLSDESLQLPEKHNVTKDTRDYITLMNLKTSMVQDTMRRVKARNYGWVDFSITYICPNNIAEVQARLKLLGSRYYDNVIIPGCTEPSPDIRIDTPFWRFCGGLFIGDAASVAEFAELYLKHAPVIMKTYNKIMWEVNVWAFLERDCGWRPLWIKADHDVSIFPLWDKMSSLQV